MIASVAVSQNKRFSPVMDVTDEREARPRRWYAAMVRINSERQASRMLVDAGIESFVATQTEIHDWSDRRKRIEKVLIPMVVFFNADDEELREVRTFSFINSLVQAPGERKPSAIPGEQIDRFRRMLNLADTAVSIEASPILPGATVRIVRGKMRGFVGELHAEPDSRARVIVRLGCLGCASLQLPLSHVERINVQ